MQKIVFIEIYQDKIRQYTASFPFFYVGQMRYDDNDNDDDDVSEDDKTQGRKKFENKNLLILKKKIII